MTILVVDANFLIHQYFSAYFKKLGHEAFSATDGIAALDWLEKNTCAAVLLDVNMPGLDGITLLKLIRERFAHLPIIIFTTLGYDQKTMQRAKDAGANGYISKTSGPSEVYAALNRSLSLSQKTAE